MSEFKITEYLKILAIPLDWHSQHTDGYVLLIIVIDDDPKEFFIGRQPNISRQMKKQFRYYHHISN